MALFRGVLVSPSSHASSNALAPLTGSSMPSSSNQSFSFSIRSRSCRAALGSIEGTVGSGIASKFTPVLPALKEPRFEGASACFLFD
jgi:hypothetical protein